MFSLQYKVKKLQKKVNISANPLKLPNSNKYTNVSTFLQTSFSFDNDVASFRILKSYTVLSPFYRYTVTSFLSFGFLITQSHQKFSENKQDFEIFCKFANTVYSALTQRCPDSAVSEKNANIVANLSKSLGLLSINKPFSLDMYNVHTYRYRYYIFRIFRTCEWAKLVLRNRKQEILEYKKGKI